MEHVLATTWIIIIGFCIIMYVLLDGFDLGIGILFPFFPKSDDKNIMISTVLPVWDGNQTWLVLGFASLYGAFPKAFSLLLPALYLPIFLMVMALLFRGITFEFRLKETGSKKLWDNLFFISSSLATFAQGIVLGTFVKGFELGGNGTLVYDVFTGFNIACGVALWFGYSLLASAWIIGKTTGPLQKKMFGIARVSLIGVTFFMMVISLWTPFIDPHIADIWFNPNYIFKLAFLPLITGALITYCAYSIHKRREYIIFWLSLAIFVCGYLGFGISTFPYLIPRVLTVFDAAAPESSLLFMLFGALLLLPLLIGYTSYSYYVFRGKVTKTIEY
jgi:cytochrome bd ubiquinol oxidase subunit II